MGQFCHRARDGDRMPFIRLRNSPVEQMKDAKRWNRVSDFVAQNLGKENFLDVISSKQPRRPARSA
jgi:hypothetical protein